MSNSAKSAADYIRNDDKSGFLTNFETFEIEDFYSLSVESLKTAITWCRTKKIYLIHRIIKRTQNVTNLSFLSDNQNLQFYKQHHLLDCDFKTWLHVAVISESHQNGDAKNVTNYVEIVEFLVSKLEVDVSRTDCHGYTALHYACGNMIFTKDLYNLLNHSSKKILILTSKDDLTPLEIASSDIEKLKIIKDVEKEGLDILLSEIDSISSAIPKINEGFKLYESKSATEIWIILLNNNDQYELMNFLKKNKNCKEKFYLSSQEFREIISNSNDNGNGLLNFVQGKKYFLDKNELIDERLYHELTGYQVKGLCQSKSCCQFYFNSALFLVLITGRFNLVYPLVRYCQFHVIQYCLLTCLICFKLLSFKIFSDQFKKDLSQVKEFCENYSIAVLSRTAIRDLTEKKETIVNFLTTTELSTKKIILEIAYLGNCFKFLCLPICQRSLTKLWRDKGPKWPALKFYVHSTIHIVFLGLLAYILIDRLYHDISIIELICYVYGFGNLLEIFRQFSLCYRYSFLKEFIKDPTNCIDIFSTVILSVTGLTRIINSKLNVEYSSPQRLLSQKNGGDILFGFHIALCCSFLLFSFKVIFFGFIFEQFGPKLKMIINMIIKDLLPLSFVFLVFIISFGVTFQSLIYPNSFYVKPSTKNLEKKMFDITIIDIFKRATYSIFDTNYCINELKDRDLNVNQDNVRQVALHILLFVYIVVVNIMMMNLLIAVFSETVTKIIEKSRVSWKAERYKDIKLFMCRSFLPPPFNILSIVIEFLIFIVPQSHDQIDCKNEKHLLQFMSFKILQAFSLKDFRYKLVEREDEREHQREIEIEYLQTSLNKLENYMNNIKSILVDRQKKGKK